MLSFLLLIPFFVSGMDVTTIDEVDKMYFGTLQNIEEKYFNVSLDLLFLDLDDDTPINIVVLPLVGGLNMFVGLMDDLPYWPKDVWCKTAGRCMKGEAYYVNTVRFNKTDPYFKKHPTDKNLKITVVYPTWQSHSLHYEQIPFYIYVSKMTKKHHWSNLRPNIPVVNEITFNMEFDYYQFTIDQAEKFNAIVTPITPDVDPDVFLSSFTPMPNFNTPPAHRYLGISDKFDVLQPNPGDPAYNCTKYPCTWGLSAVSILHRQFYYSIFWEVRNKDYTLLYEGIELGGEVRRGEYNYYKFFLPLEDPKETSNLVVSVFNIMDYGDPDIFLCKPDSNQTAPKPSWDHCDYCDGQALGSDEIIVDTKTLGKDASGYWHLAVYGYEDYSKYLVSFFKEGSIMVDNKEPIVISIKGGQSMFFRYPNMMTEYNINMNVNCEDNQFLDMYLTYKSAYTHVQPFPSPSQHDAVGNKASDGKGIYYYYNKPTQRGNYFFSLYNTGLETQNLTISIVTNQTHIILREGEMYYYQKVIKDQVLYYQFQYDETKFNATSSTSFNFIVTPMSDYGDIDLFVSTHNKFPHSKATSEWQSDDWLTDSVTIPMDQKWVKVPNAFYIGVKGNPWQEVNTFTILGYVSESVTELKENGVPYADTVRVGRYNHYQLDLRTASKLNIFLAKENANDLVQVYVNVKSKDTPSWPNKDKYAYRSTSFDVEEVITLPRAIAGLYLISVYCESASYGKDQSKFSITATMDARALMVDMYPIEVLQVAGSTEKIEMEVADQERMMLSIPVVYGEIDLYVCMNESKKCDLEHYDLKYSNWRGYDIVFDKADSHGKYINFNKWTFLTYAKADSNFIMTMDSFHKDITQVVFGTELQPGIPRKIKLREDMGYYLKYAFLVDDDWWSFDTPASEGWIIEIRDVVGVVKLYLNQDWNQNPDATHHELAEIEVGFGRETLHLLDTNTLKKGYVFMTIMNFHQFMGSELYLNVYPASANIMLLQDDYYVEEFANTQYYYFESWAVKALGFRPQEEYGFIVAESCGERVAPNLFMNEQLRNQKLVNHKPTPHSFQYAGGKTRPIDQLGNVRTEIKLRENANSESYFYMLETTTKEPIQEVGVFVTNLNNNSRPSLPDSGKLGYNNGKDLNLFIPIANAPNRFPDHKLHYALYTRKLDPKLINSGINFDTPCAVIHHNSEAVETFFRGTYPEVGAPECLGAKLCIKFTLKKDVDFNVKDVYKINCAVVDNTTGVADVYNSLWLVDGAAWNTYDYHHFHPENKKDDGKKGGIPAFGVVMIVLSVLVCCCCCCYLVAGAVIIVVILIVGLFSAGGATGASAFLGGLKEGVAGKGGKGGYQGLGDDYALDDKGTINKDLVPDSYGAL